MHVLLHCDEYWPVADFDFPFFITMINQAGFDLKTLFVHFSVNATHIVNLWLVCNVHTLNKYKRFNSSCYDAKFTNKMAFLSRDFFK